MKKDVKNYWKTHGMKFTNLIMLANVVFLMVMPFVVYDVSCKYYKAYKTDPKH